MDGDHRVPFLFGHVEDHAVAEVAGDVDQDVDAAPGVDRLLDHLPRLREVRDRTIVRDGRAAGLLDRLDHVVRRALVAAFAAQADTGIVDDDLRAGAREGERDASTDASS